MSGDGGVDRKNRLVSSDPASGMYVVRNLYFNPAKGKLVIEYELPRGGGEVAIQSFQLDPNAQAYTDDEIVGKVNTATANITRAASVDAAARPIADLEIEEGKLAANAVTNAKLAAAAARDNLDALTGTARGYIKTDPTTGEFPVIAIQRDAAGLLDVDYDDEAV